MTEKPRVSDFILFRWIVAIVKHTDVANEGLEDNLTREDRRALRRGFRWEFHRDIKRKRSDEEILQDLMEGGENCSPNEAWRIMKGIPKEKWGKYMASERVGIAEDIKTGKSDGNRWDHVQLLNRIASQWVRWFSGKKYGIVVDPDVAEAVANADIDLAGLNVELPWSPMLVKMTDAEYFFWAENGIAYFNAVREANVVGGMEYLHNPRQVEHDKRALAMWLCSVSKGEGKESYFELKVGNATVALLPRINANSLILKHKISAEAETDKGAWVRKGHFRMAKDGPKWVPGSVCRKELPYVQKVHPLEKKGMLPKSQELFAKKS